MGVEFAMYVFAHETLVADGSELRDVRSVAAESLRGKDNEGEGW